MNPADVSTVADAEALALARVKGKARSVEETLRDEIRTLAMAAAEPTETTETTYTFGSKPVTELHRMALILFVLGILPSGAVLLGVGTGSIVIGAGVLVIGYAVLALLLLWLVEQDTAVGPWRIVSKETEFRESTTGDRLTLTWKSCNQCASSNGRNENGRACYACDGLGRTWSATATR